MKTFHVYMHNLSLNSRLKIHNVPFCITTVADASRSRKKFNFSKHQCVKTPVEKRKKMLLMHYSKILHKEDIKINRLFPDYNVSSATTNGEFSLIKPAIMQQKLFTLKRVLTSLPIPPSPLLLPLPQD